MFERVLNLMLPFLYWFLHRKSQHNLKKKHNTSEGLVCFGNLTMMPKKGRKREEGLMKTSRHQFHRYAFWSHIQLRCRLFFPLVKDVPQKLTLSHYQDPPATLLGKTEGWWRVVRIHYFHALIFTKPGCCFVTNKKWDMSSQMENFDVAYSESQTFS